MNQQPLVSIGIATYNRPKGLRKALECITQQSYTNLEIIVSNDCSPVKETEEVVREFMRSDSRIKYFYQEKNLTAPRNLLFTLAKATGEFFMWADDDDERDKYFIEKCLSNIGNYSSVMCRMRAFFEKTGEIKDGPLPAISTEYSVFKNACLLLLNPVTSFFSGLHKREDILWYLNTEWFDFNDCFLAIKFYLDGKGIFYIKDYTGFQTNIVEAERYYYKPLNPQADRCFQYKPFIRECFKLINNSVKVSCFQRIILKILVIWAAARWYTKYEKQYKPFKVKLIKIMIRQVKNIAKLFKTTSNNS